MSSAERRLWVDHYVSPHIGPRTADSHRQTAGFQYRDEDIQDAAERTEIGFQYRDEDIQDAAERMEIGLDPYAHHQPKSRPQRRRTLTGAVLGSFSVAELRALVAAKDVEIGALQKDCAPLLPTWNQKDPAAARAWAEDFDKLLDRYSKARNAAQYRFTFSMPLPENMIPADGEYNAVLAAVQQNPPARTPGDLADLYARFIAAGGHSSVVSVPQPGPGVDADLNAYNALGNIDAVPAIADAAKRAAAAASDAAAHASFPAWGWGVLGVVGVLGLTKLVRG